MLLKSCSLPSLATIEPSILPDVVAGWEQMTYYDRKRTDNSNEQFFCRLHLLVGLAEAAEEILKSTIEEEENTFGTKGSRTHGILSELLVKRSTIGGLSKLAAPHIFEHTVSI